MTEKTNAMRILDHAGISYQVRTYPLEDDDINAERVAELLGLESERIFKTLIMRGDRSGPILVLAPAGTEVDSRRLARLSGDKRVEMVPQKDVFSLTGYVRGAVTALGIPRAYPVYIEETAIAWDAIGISGGAKGVELILAPTDLVQVTAGKLVDIARSA